VLSTGRAVRLDWGEARVGRNATAAQRPDRPLGSRNSARICCQRATIAFSTEIPAMSISDESPLHDFADRSMREQLQNPANLRDLLRDAVPHLVDGFDFAKGEFLKPQFPLEGWRYRESDLLFRLPYRTDEGELPVLVCVLIEHQSRPDPRVPLRTLLYAVL